MRIPHGTWRRSTGRLQWIAEQEPALTRWQRALERDRAIQQMDSRALLAFCANLEATFGVDTGREA